MTRCSSVRVSCSRSPSRSSRCSRRPTTPRTWSAGSGGYVPTRPWSTSGCRRRSPTRASGRRSRSASAIRAWASWSSPSTSSRATMIRTPPPNPPSRGRTALRAPCPSPKGLDRGAGQLRRPTPPSRRSGAARLAICPDPPAAADRNHGMVRPATGQVVVRDRAEADGWTRPRPTQSCRTSSPMFAAVCGRRRSPSGADRAARSDLPRPSPLTGLRAIGVSGA